MKDQAFVGEAGNRSLNKIREIDEGVKKLKMESPLTAAKLAIEDGDRVAFGYAVTVVRARPVEVLAYVWNTMSRDHDKEGELDKARSFAERAVKLSRTSGGQRMKGAALSFVLRLDVLAGHSHSSVADEVVTLCREGGLHLLRCMVVGFRAWLAARAGEPGADVLADEAVALADVGGRADELVAAFAGAAVGYAAEQRWDDANRCLAHAHRLAHELAHLGGLVDLMERAKGEVEAMRAQV